MAESLFVKGLSGVEPRYFTFRWYYVGELISTFTFTNRSTWEEITEMMKDFDETMTCTGSIITLTETSSSGASSGESLYCAEPAKSVEEVVDAVDRVHRGYCITSEDNVDADGVPDKNVGDIKWRKVDEKDHINPSHYQGFLSSGEQWLEAMCKLPTFQNQEVLEGALELQVRKYIDRAGRKGPKHQDLMKALWYLKFWICVIETENTGFRIQDMEDILNSK